MTKKDLRKGKIKNEKEIEILNNFLSDIRRIYKRKQRKENNNK